MPVQHLAVAAQQSNSGVVIASELLSHNILMQFQVKIKWNDLKLDPTLRISEFTKNLQYSSNSYHTTKSSLLTSSSKKL